MCILYYMRYVYYRLFYRALLQKRPMFSGSLLIVSASYAISFILHDIQCTCYNLFLNCICVNTALYIVYMLHHFLHTTPYTVYILYFIFKLYSCECYIISFILHHIQCTYYILSLNCIRVNATLYTVYILHDVLNLL